MSNSMDTHTTAFKYKLKNVIFFMYLQPRKVNKFDSEYG